MTTNAVPPVRRPFFWTWRLGGVCILVVALAVAWSIWSRPTRVMLSDGRTLVIDKISSDSKHTMSSPITVQRLWMFVTRRLKAWPSTTYHGQKGTVGVFHHSDPTPGRAHDVLFLVDRDGWWWGTKQKGFVSSDRRLAVFPPIDYPSPPRFEVWNDGALVGSGPLQFTPPSQPIIEQSLPLSPIRVEAGSTSIVLNGIDVTTRDDARPSEADGLLKVETLRHREPAIMRLSDFTLSDPLGRGCQCPLDKDRRFTTDISPHSPLWYVTFLAWRDEFDPLDREATFSFDPAPGRSADSTVKVRETGLGQAQTDPGHPEGPRWYDLEVDGVGWRIAIVPPETTWVYRHRFGQGPEHRVEARDAPLLICEREPRKVAALRIEFQRPSGELLYQAIVDGQPDDESGRLQVNCPKLDPSTLYEIRVGVHVPVRVMGMVRPRILGKDSPKPAVIGPSAEPFPSGLDLGKG